MTSSMRFRSRWGDGTETASLLERVNDYGVEAMLLVCLLMLAVAVTLL
jgi:hypothetical protein